MLRLPVLVFLVSLVIQGTSADPSHGSSSSLKLAIPIDTDSPAAWSEAIAGAPLVGIIVLNPSNGPGQSVDANYAQLVYEAQAKGIKVIGYVYTQWANGNVSVAQAEGWIDKYYSWYHVDGIMLDEANDSCDRAPLNFYADLYSYAKDEPGHAIVLLNPGEATGECYAAVSDVLLTFENDYADYLRGYVGDAWTDSFSPGHFFHIVFDVPTVAEMEAVISTAIARGVGWVYVTDLDNSNGNPYSSLPSYFDQELAYVGGLNRQRPTYPAAMPVMLILGFVVAGSVLVVVKGRKRVSD